MSILCKQLKWRNLIQWKLPNPTPVQPVPLGTPTPIFNFRCFFFLLFCTLFIQTHCVLQQNISPKACRIRQVSLYLYEYMCLRSDDSFFFCPYNGCIRIYIGLVIAQKPEFRYKVTETKMVIVLNSYIYVCTSFVHCISRCLVSQEQYVIECMLFRLNVEQNYFICVKYCKNQFQRIKTAEVLRYI